MHSKNIPLFFIVASLTSTSLGFHHLVAAAARRSLDMIVARQLSPTACEALCTNVESTFESCGTVANAVSCVCTTTIASNVQDCVNCLVANDPTVAEVSDAQMVIDDFEGICTGVGGVPSISLDTNVGSSMISLSSQSALGSSVAPAPILTSSTSIAQSTVIVPPPVTTVSQMVVGPSSTTSSPSTASSVKSTSTTGSGISPSIGSASSNKINLHWTGALLGLAAGNLLVF